MKYISRQATEVYAEQWPTDPGDHFHSAADCAREIVAWVNADGGEARYEPVDGVAELGYSEVGRNRIAVRTINGWAYAAPGHYIVMGDARFRVCRNEHSDPVCSECRSLRDFYPCDPETFEKRWEPAP